LSAQNDNVPPHGARTVPPGLQKVGVAYLVWPAMTPGLNPVEQVWDLLKQRLEDCTPPSREPHVALASQLHHKAGKEQKTSLSSCHCSKWWK
uniref:Tc1-like transposase DDE domain-containing protein n=1 Tax=Oryzias latipes TaxID=8090 RepID=A0A3P9HIB8_ORYLA